jgi:hypothetical protein
MLFVTFNVKVFDADGQDAFIAPRANAMTVTRSKGEKRDVFLDSNRLESMLIRSKVFPGIRNMFSELPENAKVSGRSTKRKTIQVTFDSDRK